jgi:ATP-dependent helicase/nuclease subunit A
MTTTLLPHPIVAQMHPSAEQEPPIFASGADVVVTAGAGAGKTRTLVGRYLALLAAGVNLRAVIAITFTVKAAREMRNRVRNEMRRYLEQPDLPEVERERWQALYSELDAARISTIHSLCADILAAHPAEAQVDPRITVLDEGRAALLRAQVLDETLAWAADEPSASALFVTLGERSLRAALSDLLGRRLDTETVFARLPADILAHWRDTGPELTTADAALAPVAMALQRLFAWASARYAARKQAQNVLDFDDLEAGALALLTAHPSVRARWQADIQALLVDEFQDTNARQRALLRLLNEPGGKLFIVGDAKQSIYRFRGADVTVFRAERQQIAQDGLAFSLRTSYRAHADLVTGLNDLLRPVLGVQAAASRPWVEPFEAIAPARAQPGPGFQPPYIELHLTVGTKQDALGRAADALAAYLRELVAACSIHNEREAQVTPLTYGDIAILCRASNSFAAYEEALARAGIPYVTVAGGGFYDRPEIRDLLNALAALADPTDDLALVGLLRSPIAGLTDAALYRLSEAPAQNWWLRLQQHGAILSGADGARVPRIVRLLRDLHDQVGRVAVADLLKALLDATDYRAALRLAGDTRGARNVSKLLADAQASGLVSISDFLDTVNLLKDSGVREGEARTVSEGAVQIMSVHAAKGLEFPVVVIGDINYASRSHDRLLLHPTLGLALPIADAQGVEPAIHAAAAAWEADQDEAESARLLYVAATRAQEKLIISGCVRLKKDQTLGWVNGWLKLIAGPAATNLANQRLMHQETGDRRHELPLRVGAATPVACVVYEPLYAPRQPLAAPAAETLPTATDLAAPLLLAPLPRVAGWEPDTARRVWRVAPPAARPYAPAWVIGSLVHEALAAWRFPDADFPRWAAARSRSYGLTAGRQVEHAISESVRLLHRFAAHPLYQEMDRAAQRLHEAPYSMIVDGRADEGVIDALFRQGEQWTIVEFKTDAVSSVTAVAAHLQERGYLEQAGRYAMAVERLLGQTPRVIFCWLNVAGRIVITTIPSSARP